MEIRCLHTLFQEKSFLPSDNHEERHKSSARATYVISPNTTENSLTFFEDKKDSARALRKAKTARDKVKSDRLEKLSYWRVKERVDQLESKKKAGGSAVRGGLTPQEAQTLKRLHEDLNALEKKRQQERQKDKHGEAGDNKDAIRGRWRQVRKGEGKGRESIYWDPVLNPSGIAPPELPDLTREQVAEQWKVRRKRHPGKHTEDSDDSAGETDEEVAAIPMPWGSVPGVDIDTDEERELDRQEETRKKEEEQAQRTEYSSKPVLRDVVKEVTIDSGLVPAALLKRKIGAKSAVKPKQRLGPQPTIIGPAQPSKSGPVPGPAPGPAPGPQLPPGPAGPARPDAELEGYDDYYPDYDNEYDDYESEKDEYESEPQDDNADASRKAYVEDVEDEEDYRHSANMAPEEEEYLRAKNKRKYEDNYEI